MHGTRQGRFCGRCSLLMLAMILSLAPSALAQTGSIRGQVVEAVTLQPLPGINVVVEGTT